MGGHAEVMRKTMKHLTLIALAVLAVGCSGGNKGDAPAAGPTADNSTPKPSTDTGSSDTAANQPGGMNPNDSATEKEFPVPFYPGSTEDNSSPIPTMGHDLAGGERSLSSNRLSTDSVQQVFDFYKPKLAKIEEQNVAPDLATMTGSAANGDVVVVTARKEPQGTTISIGAEIKKK